MLIYEISFAHKRPFLKNLPYVRIHTAGKETVMKRFVVRTGFEPVSGFIHFILISPFHIIF
jgi:hypothetical protein